MRASWRRQPLSGWLSTRWMCLRRRWRWRWCVGCVGAGAGASDVPPSGSGGLSNGGLHPAVFAPGGCSHVRAKDDREGGQKEGLLHLNIRGAHGGGEGAVGASDALCQGLLGGGRDKGADRPLRDCDEDAGASPATPGDQVDPEAKRRRSASREWKRHI